jgi:hypothetical protein
MRGEREEDEETTDDGRGPGAGIQRWAGAGGGDLGTGLIGLTAVVRRWNGK